MKNWVSSLLFLSALAIYLPVHAQEIIYSPYEKFDSRSGDYSVVGKTDGHIYTYRSGSDGFFLDAWDDSMNKTATVVLDFFPQRIYETRFIAYPNKIVVLYQAVEHGYVVQYAASLDGTGRLQGSPIALDSAKTGFFGPTRDYFSSAISDNKKHIAIFTTVARGSELRVSGTLLDDNVASAHRFAATYNNDNDISAGEALLGNDGSFYLPILAQVGGRNYADGIWMLSIPADGSKHSVVELPLAGHYAASTFMRLDATSSRINIAGFYSDKKAGNYEGLLISSYDVAARTFSPVRAIPFDESLYNASGERSRRKAFNDFQVRQLIIRNDGGFVLVAEAFYMSTRSSYSPYGYYSSYYSPFIGNTNVREYHYNDIMALSYDGSGNRQWQAFVRKEQYSQEDAGRFSSYTLLNTGGTLGFLFNDFGSRQSSIQLATIDADGKTTTHSLAAGTSQDPDWLPRAGKQVSGRELIVPCLKRRELCFAKVVF